MTDGEHERVVREELSPAGLGLEVGVDGVLERDSGALAEADEVVLPVEEEAAAHRAVEGGAVALVGGHALVLVDAEAAPAQRAAACERVRGAGLRVGRGEEGDSGGLGWSGGGLWGLADQLL